MAYFVHLWVRALLLAAGVDLGRLRDLEIISMPILFIIGRQLNVT